jgi:hypothetical protein
MSADAGPATLRIDTDGDWLADGVQVTHPGVLANLRANLRRDAQGYYLHTRTRIPVQVDDVPWVVTRLEAQGERLRVVLNDGTEESIDPASVRVGPGDVPYCPVKRAAFEARFSRPAAFQLLALARHDEASGRTVVRLGAREIVLSRRE